MVRNAGSSKERRRGAFIMRIQLNPGNGQCGLGKVPGRGGRGRGRCRSLGCLMLRLLSIVYLVRLILKPIRADFRFKIKTASIFLVFPAQSPLHGLPRVRAMSPSKYRPVDVDGRPQEHNKPICRYPHSTQSCVYHPLGLQILLHLWDILLSLNVLENVNQLLWIFRLQSQLHCAVVWKWF